MTSICMDGAEVQQRYLLEAATVPAPVEATAKAMHQAVWRATTPWEYDNPKLRDHYRFQAWVAINAYEACRSSISASARAVHAYCKDSDANPTTTGSQTNAAGSTR
jgi:hypothetical protein